MRRGHFFVQKWRFPDGGWSRLWGIRTPEAAKEIFTAGCRQAPRGRSDPDRAEVGPLALKRERGRRSISPGGTEKHLLWKYRAGLSPDGRIPTKVLTALEKLSVLSRWNQTDQFDSQGFRQDKEFLIRHATHPRLDLSDAVFADGPSKTGATRGERILAQAE